MIFKQTNLLNHAVKNSDKFGRILLACYSVDTSIKEKNATLERYCASKKLKIVRCYDRVILKYVHNDDSYQSSKISNKKQSP